MLDLSELKETERSKRGFTLIELLVVISIVTALIAVLLPSLGQARETARQTACLARLKQVTLGAITYAHAYKQHLPPNANNGSNSYGCANKPYNQWGGTASGTGFYLLSADYVDYNGFFCPSNMIVAWADRNALGAPAPGVMSARGGYMWRFVRANGNTPHSAVATEGSTTPMAKLDVGQVFPLGYAALGYSAGYTLAPSRTAYAADQMNGYRTNTGARGVMAEVHKTGANAVYYDGHGQYRKMELLIPYEGTTLMSADDRVYHRGFLQMLDIQ